MYIHWSIILQSSNITAILRSREDKLFLFFCSGAKNVRPEINFENKQNSIGVLLSLSIIPEKKMGE